MKTLIVILITLWSGGCASNTEALQYVTMTTNKLQPAIDAMDKICDSADTLAVVYPEKAAELAQQCDKLWIILNDVRTLQESVVLILGGQPCTDDCEE